MTTENKFRHIPAEDIQRVKDHYDIVEYIGLDVELKKEGRVYNGLCPFHSEKSGSFKVYPDTQSFHCYGCGIHGDIIDYEMLKRDIGFYPAATDLASRAGMSLGGATVDPALLKKERAKWARKKRERERKAAVEYRQKRDAWKSLPVILKRHRIPLTDWPDSSPVKVRNRENEARTFIEGMFGFGSLQNATIWNSNNRRDTGPGTFWTPAKLLKEGIRGKFITASMFPNDGCGGRKGDRVVLCPYIVIECDEIYPDPNTGEFRKPETREEKIENLANGLALVNFLRTLPAMELQAIVYTGHRSAHAYFTHPGKEMMAYLDTVADSFCIDKSFKVSTQPWRLPGFQHEKNLDDELEAVPLSSQLLWMKGGYA